MLVLFMVLMTSMTCLTQGDTTTDMSNVTHGYPILPDERQPHSITLGDAAVGSLIPTSAIIVLAAVIRILQVMQQRRANRETNANVAV